MSAIKGSQTFKIVLMGDGGVGKTSLVLRYFDRGFKASHQMTIGADFNAKKWGKHMIQIWDLAGQDRFTKIRKGYYKSAVGALLLFDLADYKTFQNLEKWVKEFFEGRDRNAPIMIVANKVDLRGKSPNVISQEDAMRAAERLRIRYKLDLAYTETSALNGLNVDAIFEDFINWGILGQRTPGSVFYREKSIGGEAPADEPASTYEYVASPKEEEKPEEKKEKKIDTKKFKF